MLYQIHYEFRDGKTDIVAQQEINSIDEMKVFEMETTQNHSLPEGAQWMLCN